MENSQTTPYLSIIVATYNAGCSIGRALRSIKSLSYDNWECLIVDGASTDGTINIVEKFKRSDGRFRYISEPDKGLYDAFNKGWTYAIGKWIYYLGADDELLPSGIKKLVDIATEADDNIAIISGGVIRVRQDGSTHKIYSNGFIGSHQSMIMRRCVLEEMSGFNYNRYKILADFDLFTRIKNHYYDAMNCDVLVAYFHAGGTSEQLKSMLQITKEKYNILKSDSFCKHPILQTMNDSLRTILGNILYNLLKIIKTKAR